MIRRPHINADAIGHRAHIRTDWYPSGTHPARPGYYERMYCDGIYLHYWDNCWRSEKGGAPHWRQANDYPQWRGLAIRQDGLQQAIELLKECGVALDDWINTYASELCDKKRVKEAHERISEGGGTLAYIADIRKKIRSVIDGVNIK